MLDNAQPQIPPWEFDYTSYLFKPIRQVRTAQQRQQVNALRQIVYSETYREIKLSHADPYDDYSVVMFSEDDNREVISTARIVFDSPLGLPEDNVFGHIAGGYRSQGLSIAELGRFVIAKPNTALLKNYYHAFDKIARHSSIDIMLIVMRAKDQSFHRRLLGAQALGITIPHGFGSYHDFVAMQWVISQTPCRFFDWLGVDPTLSHHHEVSL